MATLDPTKAFFSPDNTGGLLKQVDNAATVDNIFIFTDGTNKFQWINNSKGVYPLSQAKILAGDTADKTTLLQTIFSHGDIRTVVLDAQQVITINGTLNCGGKKIEFTSGAKFTGTGTISNAVITADYSDQIFDTTITLTGCKLAGDRFSAKWFGATGNGSTDDQPAIQKAGDTIISNLTLSRTLYFPPGTYKITAPLIFQNWSGTNYSQFTLNLLGQEGADFNNTAAEAIIDATSINQTFAIGYQLTRSCVIKGLVIRGAYNPSFASYRAYVEKPYETFASDFNGVRDHPNSPYSGIVIDPFRNTNTLDVSGRYPGLGTYYRGDGTQPTSGSSGIRIVDCRVYGFAVDIMLSPNGQTQNAENVHVVDCTLEVAKAAYASAQDQTKDNFVLRCKSWDRVHTLIDTMTYGAGTGQPPYVDGWNVAGDIIEIYRLFPLRAQCSFRNIFAESLWRIGNGWAGTGLTIYDSAFNFNKNSNPVIYPPTHIEGGRVKFKNCVLKYYDDLFDKAIRVKGPGYAFEDCQFDKPPLLDFSYSNENMVSATFRSCLCSYGKLTDFEAGNGYFSSLAAAPYVAYGNITLRDGGILQGPSNSYVSDLIVRLNASGSYQRELRCGTRTLTVNDSARTGVLSGFSGTNFEYQIAAGDYLISYDGTVYGRLSSVDRASGTANVIDIPVNVSGVIVDNMAVCWAETFYGQFIGDLTVGSPTIANVDFDTILPMPYVGQRLKIGHTIYTFVVDAVNVGAKTITMSWNADYSETKAFNSWNKGTDIAPLEFTSILRPEDFTGSTWPVFIPAGAKINTRKNAYTLADNNAFICVKPGFMSPSSLSPARINQALFDRKDERATDAIYFTVGDAGFPAASDTTYTNSRFIDRNVVVFRNFVPQFNTNPGGGTPYITKAYNSDTITFSTALVAGEKIMIITC